MARNLETKTDPQPVYEPGTGGYTNYVGGGYHQPDPGDNTEPVYAPVIDMEARRQLRDLQVELSTLPIFPLLPTRRPTSQVMYGSGSSYSSSANFSYVVGTGLVISDATASTDSTHGALVVTGGAGIGGKLNVGGNVGFNGTTAIAKPTITGSKGANAALTALLTALANYGLLTDSTT